MNKVQAQTVLAWYARATPGPVTVYEPPHKNMREIRDAEGISIARFRPTRRFNKTLNTTEPSEAPANAHLFAYALDPDIGYAALIKENQELKALVRYFYNITPPGVLPPHNELRRLLQ